MTESKKDAARTTIVGGQPPGNERDVDAIPVGLESLLGMAAMDEALAERLLAERAELARRCSVELTATEQALLAQVDEQTLQNMLTQVAQSLPDGRRRHFLQVAAQAALVLGAGGALTTLGGCETCAPGTAVTGSRPDLPPNPEPSGSNAKPAATQPAGSPAKPPQPMAGATAPKPKPGGPAPTAVAGLTATVDPQPDKKEEKKKKKKPTDRRTRGIRPDKPRRRLISLGIQPETPKNLRDPFEE